MPDSIEDPVKRHAKVTLAAFARPLQSGKDLLKQQRISRILFLAPEVHHTNRDVNLGMNHPLRGQLLNHPICRQLILISPTQPPGHGLEGFQKT